MFTGRGLRVCGPHRSPALWCGKTAGVGIIDLLFSLGYEAISFAGRAKATCGWTIIPLTRCSFQFLPHLEFLQSCQCCDKPALSGCQRILEGRTMPSSLSMNNFWRHSAVSISSSLEYEIPCPNLFYNFTISTFPVSVFTDHGKRMCLAVLTRPPVMP